MSLVGVSPRHRGSGNRPAVRRAGRHRGATEDALPPDAGRRRGGQPRHARRRGAKSCCGGSTSTPTTSSPSATATSGSERRPGRAWPSPSRGVRRTVSETEISQFRRGLPRRYLQLFDRPTTIYRHVQLSRDIQPDHVHATLERKGDGVGADGRHARQAVPVLEHLRGAVVVRDGHPARPRDDESATVWSSTSSSSPTRIASSELNDDGRAQSCGCSRRSVAGAVDVAARACAPREQGVAAPRSSVRRFAPVIHSDNQSSRRYTIFDIIASNADRLAASRQPGDLASWLRRRPRS